MNHEGWKNTIKEYRKKLGYTQKEMAEFLGARLRTYRSWEGGKRGPLEVYKKMIIKKIKEKLLSDAGITGAEAGDKLSKEEKHA